jgi:purine-binding chemotaxis protein CheW
MVEGELADRAAVPLAFRTGETVDVVVFELGALRFALPTVHVDELTHAFAFDPLPSAPDVVAGAANLRGEVLAVFDLRPRFRLPAKEVDVSDHFVVARAGPRRVILHVDRVLELRSVVLVAFEVNASSTEPVVGAGAIEDGILFIYDLSRVLDDTQGLGLDRALSQVRSGASA